MTLIPADEHQRRVGHLLGLPGNTMLGTIHHDGHTLTWHTLEDGQRVTHRRKLTPIEHDRLWESGLPGQW